MIRIKEFEKAEYPDEVNPLDFGPFFASTTAYTFTVDLLLPHISLINCAVSISSFEVEYNDLVTEQDVEIFIEYKLKKSFTKLLGD